MRLLKESTRADEHELLAGHGFELDCPETFAGVLHESGFNVAGSYIECEDASHAPGVLELFLFDGVARAEDLFPMGFRLSWSPFTEPADNDVDGNGSLRAE